jgi:hypothetical protein
VSEPGELLDDFRDLSGWSAVASGQAELRISQDDGPHGKAMRLDFDFRGGGGFVVVRKSFERRLPTSWAFRFFVRGSAPANKFEFKLADPSGKNVWWHHRDAFQFPVDWQPLRIRSREVEFAWGPAGGGAMRELATLELAIAAGPGGRGTVWVEDLRFEDLEPKALPTVRASSEAKGHAPARVLDGSRETSWRGAPSSGPQWIELDFQTDREYGGLVIDWEPGAAPRAFDVRSSDDGIRWTTAYEARQAEGLRSYVYLPGGASRFLRLDLHESAGVDFGIVELDVRPHDFSRSKNEFFQNVAKEQRRGLHPRWLHREQMYWSPVGVEGAPAAALFGEDGLLEVDRGSFSLEPFLFVDGELVSWADAEVSQELAEGCLPIPSSVWRAKELEATTTAFATGSAAAPVLWVRYRLASTRDATLPVCLFVAVRPYQVTPPWQAFRGLGGASPIRELAWRDGAVWVNGSKVVIPMNGREAVVSGSAPSGFGAAAFEQGEIGEYLARGELPARSEVRDAFAHASGALRYDLELAPGSAHEIFLAVPFGAHDPAGGDWAELRRLSPRHQLDAAALEWRKRLGRIGIRLGDAGSECLHALRTATAHILMNRDGPALQPGPRRYTRSWIRDAATMAAALLRMGCPDPVRDFLRWYTPHQAKDGNVPCCVDRDGPDWLPEHDSHGQLVFTIAEHYRLTGDRAFLAEMWPSVVRAVDYLEALRRQRLGPEFAAAGKRACYGILPESASHEGYLAHPVHAYWDDFWALRGLDDAAELARELGDAERAARFATLRDALRQCLYASIEATIRERRLAYVPGSVEWADFDATATATALTTTDAVERLPQAALAYTYDEYLAGFRKRCRGEIEWANYTAYEIRIVGALVRLGRREEAHELLDFLLSDRRPPPWNQWPEISWRDPRSPGHLGDLPHTWIAAEYVLAVLGLFAFEHPAERSLVLAAGVPARWLDGGRAVVVERLPTYYGTLGYTLAREGADRLRLVLSAGLEPPPGGIVVRPPLPRRLRRAWLDGEKLERFDATSVTLARAPATLVMDCQATEMTVPG